MKSGRYPLKLIKVNYSYTMEEIAELLAIGKETASRWKKDGLKVIPATRPYLIHSSDLRAFLEKLNKRHQSVTPQDKIHCVKCRTPQEVKGGSVRLVILPSKQSCIKGICKGCGTPTNKFIKVGDWNENHPLHPDFNASLKGHSGVCDYPRKCKVEGSYENG